MAKMKAQLDRQYINEELARVQQSLAKDNESTVGEQYASPESMHKRHNSHRGSKSQTLGYKG